MEKFSNVDYDEIKKFEDIASYWWDTEGKCKPLHQINPLRLSYILKNTGGLFGKKVLDVGCGGGILSEAMATYSAEVTGLDMGASAIKVAQIHALKSGVAVSYIQQTVEDHLSANPGYYDVVTCMEVLEHVPDPFSIVSSCARLVQPGGHVFFSTLNRNLKSYLLAIIGAEYLMRIIPRGTHDYSKFIRPSEMMSMIDRTSLTERGIAGFSYFPLKDSYELGKNISVNYIIHAQNSQRNSKPREKTKI